MVLIGQKVYLFGGRTNDILKNHVPKTFEIKDSKRNYYVYMIYDIRWRYLMYLSYQYF
jgi:hypothetical protein